MKVTLTTPDGQVLVAKPSDAGSFVMVDGASCAKCKRPAPLLAHGRGKTIESRDTYRADAVCWSCGAPVGVLRVKLGTLFGLEEDEVMAELVRSRGIRVY